MKTVSVKNRCKFSVAGKPAARLESIPAPAHVAAIPHQIPLIRPRLLVKPNDFVKTGTPLIEDKGNPNLKLLSPGGGHVMDIQYGPRRVIEAIIIKIAPDEPYVEFPVIDETQISGMGREEIIDALMARGLWPFIRSIPFKGVADPAESPAAVWVPLDILDPFHPHSDVYLAEGLAKEQFLFGIKVLQKLAGRAYVCEHTERPVPDDRLRQIVTHRAAGPFPAGEPGVMHYQTKQSAQENRAWYVAGQDVLLLAEALLTGRYPTARVMTISGGHPDNNRHVRTRIGAPLKSLVKQIESPEAYRWVAGGLFTGFNAAPDGFMGLYETALMLVPEVTEKELLGFARPGLKKPTSSRTFLSAITRPTLTVDADRHGELRACVNCSYCAAICPVGILPQYTYKCIYAEEIEEALAHGLLDCVECGLCSYVCPSKIELTETFKDTKHKYYWGKI